MEQYEEEKEDQFVEVADEESIHEDEPIYESEAKEDGEAIHSERPELEEHGHSRNLYSVAMELESALHTLDSDQDTPDTDDVTILNQARTYLATLIRKDHDELEVDSAIAQNLIDEYTDQMNHVLIATTWMSVLTNLYQIVSSIFVVIGDDGNSTILERGISVIPPAMISSVITCLIFFLHQLRVVEKLKELTNIKGDADYVISKLKPLYRRAERADTIDKLVKLDDVFCGETSSLLQRVTRALSKSVKKEERSVRIRKYRYLALRDLNAQRQYETIRTMLERGDQVGVSPEDITHYINEYGEFIGV